MQAIKQSKLNPQQELFCTLYARDEYCFGNGVQAYAQAYKIDIGTKKGYGVARANSSRLLTNADILNRVNELLDMQLNDSFVDKQLGIVITQGADLRAKVAAIGEYNKVRGRHTEKHKHEFEGVTSEALAERAAEILAGIIGNREGVGNEKSGE